MRRKRAPRRLVVEETVWLWSVSHAHTKGRNPRGKPGDPDYPDCRELLTLRRSDDPHARLRLVFRMGPGRIVSGGLWPSGSVGDSAGRDLNLHEPGAVRRLLDEAVARELLPVARGTTDVDGWPLFDSVAAEREPEQEQEPVQKPEPVQEPEPEPVREQNAG